MISPEAKTNIEIDLWKPKVTLRPHHLEDVSVRGALYGRNIIAINPRIMDLQENYPEDLQNYVNDTFGITNSAREAQKEFNQQIMRLKNNDIVHLDLAKDGLCNACPVGKHCMATNYPLFGDNIDRFKRDSQALQSIHEDLLSYGCREGKDFIFKETEHKLLNYDGASLWENNQPQIVTVKFNSMLVKAGALRRLPIWR